MTTSTDCRYCETQRSYDLPDHAFEVYLRARDEYLAIDGIGYEEALDLADEVARRVEAGEVDHGKLSTYWQQIAHIRGELARLRPDQLADHLDQHGNPEGAARIRAGKHPYQQEGTQQERGGEK